MTSLPLSHSHRLARAQQPPVLDLTTPAPESRVARAPGGGVDSSRRRSPYDLPLELRLRAVDLESIPIRRPFRMEVEVTNIGEMAFDLPASRDYDRLQQDGLSGRRTANLAFLLSKVTGAADALVEVVAVLSGAAAVPGSLRRIEPGETLRIRLDASLARLRYSPEGRNLLGEKVFDLRAAYWESELEDDRFVVQNRSERVLSESVRVGWQEE